jgi:hypothetical protein
VGHSQATPPVVSRLTQYIAGQVSYWRFQADSDRRAPEVLQFLEISQWLYATMRQLALLIMQTAFNAPLSPIAYVLASVRERCVMTVFWAALLLPIGVALLYPSSGTRISVAIGLGAVAVLWVGYPIAVFHCFTNSEKRNVGVILLVLAVAMSLAATNGAKNRLTPSTATTPFISRALQRVERQMFGNDRLNVVLTVIALLFFGFFGAYVHTRVRAGIAGLQAG